MARKKAGPNQSSTDNAEDATTTDRKSSEKPRPGRPKLKLTRSASQSNRSSSSSFQSRREISNSNRSDIDESDSRGLTEDGICRGSISDKGNFDHLSLNEQILMYNRLTVIQYKERVLRRILYNRKQLMRECVMLETALNQKKKSIQNADTHQNSMKNTDSNDHLSNEVSLHNGKCDSDSGTLAQHQSYKNGEVTGIQEFEQFRKLSGDAAMIAPIDTMQVQSDQYNSNSKLMGSPIKLEPKTCVEAMDVERNAPLYIDTSVGTDTIINERFSGSNGVLGNNIHIESRPISETSAPYTADFLDMTDNYDGYDYDDDEDDDDVDDHCNIVNEKSTDPKFKTKGSIAVKHHMYLQGVTKKYPPDDEQKYQNPEAMLDRYSMLYNNLKERISVMESAKHTFLPPSVVEPRPKTHHDILLEEMRFVATDFNEERKWKLSMSNTVAQLISQSLPKRILSYGDKMIQRVIKSIVEHINSESPKLNIISEPVSMQNTEIDIELSQSSKLLLTQCNVLLHHALKGQLSVPLKFCPSSLFDEDDHSEALSPSEIFDPLEQIMHSKGAGNNSSQHLAIMLESRCSKSFNLFPQLIQGLRWIVSLMQLSIGAILCDGKGKTCTASAAISWIDGLRWVEINSESNNYVPPQLLLVPKNCMVKWWMYMSKATPRLRVGTWDAWKKISLERIASKKNSTQLNRKMSVSGIYNEKDTHQGTGSPACNAEDEKSRSAWHDNKCGRNMLDVVVCCLSRAATDATLLSNMSWYNVVLDYPSNNAETDKEEKPSYDWAVLASTIAKSCTRRLVILHDQQLDYFSKRQRASLAHFVAPSILSSSLPCTEANSKIFTEILATLKLKLSISEVDFSESDLVERRIIECEMPPGQLKEYINMASAESTILAFTKDSFENAEKVFTSLGRICIFSSYNMENFSEGVVFEGIGRLDSQTKQREIGKMELESRCGKLRQVDVLLSKSLQEGKRCIVVIHTNAVLMLVSTYLRLAGIQFHLCKVLNKAQFDEKNRSINIQASIWRFANDPCQRPLLIDTRCLQEMETSFGPGLIDLVIVFNEPLEDQLNRKTSLGWAGSDWLKDFLEYLHCDGQKLEIAYLILKDTIDEFIPNGGNIEECRLSQFLLGSSVYSSANHLSEKNLSKQFFELILKKRSVKMNSSSYENSEHLEQYCEKLNEICFHQSTENHFDESNETGYDIDEAGIFSALNSAKIPIYPSQLMHKRSNPANPLSTFDGCIRDLDGIGAQYDPLIRIFPQFCFAESPSSINRPLYMHENFNPHLQCTLHLFPKKVAPRSHKSQKKNKRPVAPGVQLGPRATRTSSISTHVTRRISAVKTNQTPSLTPTSNGNQRVIDKIEEWTPAEDALLLQTVDEFHTSWPIVTYALNKDPALRGRIRSIAQANERYSELVSGIPAMAAAKDTTAKQSIPAIQPRPPRGGVVPGTVIQGIDEPFSVPKLKESKEGMGGAEGDLRGVQRARLAMLMRVTRKHTQPTVILHPCFHDTKMAVPKTHESYSRLSGEFSMSGTAPLSSLLASDMHRKNIVSSVSLPAALQSAPPMMAHHHAPAEPQNPSPQVPPSTPARGKILLGGRGIAGIGVLAAQNASAIGQNAVAAHVQGGVGSAVSPRSRSVILSALGEWPVESQQMLFLAIEKQPETSLAINRILRADLTQSERVEMIGKFLADITGGASPGSLNRGHEALKDAPT